MYIQEAYDQTYGLFDYDDPNASSLGLVRMHNAERLDRCDRFHSLLQRFIQHRLHDLLGISFIEFLKLPRSTIELIFEVSADTALAKTDELDALKDTITEGSK